MALYHLAPQGNWEHKGCSGIRGRLKAVKDYKCRICTGEITLPTGQPLESVDMGNVSLETKDKFCYLGDMYSASGGAEESCIARIRCGWKKFRELLPLLTFRVLSLRTKGRVFDACVLFALFFMVVRLGQLKPMI